MEKIKHSNFQEKFISTCYENFLVDIQFKSKRFKTQFLRVQKSGKLEKIFSKINLLINNKILETKLYLSILITNDKEISEINNKYRNKPYPTNIISFPTNEFQMLMTNNKKTKNHEIYFGDIVISMEKIIIEAFDEKKKVQDHFLHLMVHGILHLIGFEHCTERKAKKMEEVEKNILNFVDIKNPYS